MSPRQTSADPPPAAQGGTSSIKVPADLQEGIVLEKQIDLSTPPKAGGKASSELPDLNEEDELVINQVLYGHSGKRRLPVFIDICPG
jgi:hypothetical protein